MMGPEGFYDVQGPVALRSDWWWLLGVVAVLVLAGVVWGLIKVFRHARTVVAAVPVRMPWEIALEAFDILEKGPLLAQATSKEYYSALSDIVRSYIEGRFAIHAPGMTTEEFMEKARNSAAISDAHKSFLKDFLDASDMVKFAKFIPSLDQMGEALRLARRFVEETGREQPAGHGI